MRARATTSVPFIVYLLSVGSEMSIVSIRRPFAGHPVPQRSPFFG